MSKVLITTSPFGEYDKFPIEMLEKCEVDYVLNPFKRRVTEEELGELIQDVDILIAGTEKISEAVLSRAKNLRLISRVGIGLDNVDLLAAREKGIAVSYTPDAPAPAVAELTIGAMISLLRFLHVANSQIHSGTWIRHFGRRFCDITIGIIGAGRIGSRVIELLQPFKPKQLLFYDRNPEVTFPSECSIRPASIDQILKLSDLVTLHLPLTVETKNLIDARELRIMKSDAMLINTSRGGIVNELGLYRAMQDGFLAGAAIDVFDQEPYDGPLRDIERCLLTAHMGSMSIDCRSRMEIEATKEVVAHLSGRAVACPVPNEEYEMQALKRYQ